MDPEINRLFTALADALCQWERDTGRGGGLTFVPEQPDEQSVILRDGKPITEKSPADMLLTIADSGILRPEFQSACPIIRAAAADCAEAAVGRIAD